MSEDFEIEIEEVKNEKSKAFQLPVNFITVGNVENDDVKIYMHEDVFNKIEDYSHSNTKKELGSIMVGYVSDQLGKVHVVISDFIEAKYTDASAATLTFTHESWEYINSEHEKKYKDKKIIGWQHTHPNYGIFLSNYDMFIQENFFNLPFQIAYVVDPVQNIRGFFQWKNGKVQKCTGYYIYNDIGVKIKCNIKEPKKEKAKEKKSFEFGTIFLLMLIFLLSLLFYNSLNNLEDKYSELSNNYMSDEEVVDKANEIEIVKPLENKEENKNLDGMVLKKYTIQKGDSLTTICEKNNLNIMEFKHIIKAINGIENEDEIFAGTVILIPVSN